MSSGRVLYLKIFNFIVFTVSNKAIIKFYQLKIDRLQPTSLFVLVWFMVCDTV